MTQQITATFTITIKQQAEGYTIEADGPEDIWVEVQPFPGRDALLSAEEEAFIANELDPSEEIQSLGQRLYQAMFVDTNISNALHEARGLVKANQGRLRLRLEIEPQELATLPWEAMHDGQDWLAVQSTAPMVRRLTGGKGARAPHPVAGALKVLCVAASPQDQDRLDIEAMTDDLEQALQEAIADKKVVFDKHLHTTRQELHQHLVKNYHVLYFAGHGSPQGLYLDDGYGEVGEIDGVPTRSPGYPDVMSAEDWATLLEGRSTRLIFLAACNTAARPATTEPGQPQELLLQSFAEKVARRTNLPAIVAMQYFVSHLQANKLTAQFFATIAAFEPVDVALTEARKAVLSGSGMARDVLAPVLYLQSESGALFAEASDWAQVEPERVFPFEPKTVAVAAGPFIMGSGDEAHTVNVPYPYRIGKYPVTNKQYAAFIEDVKSQDQPGDWFLRRPPRGKDNHPVVGVSWYDALAYCRWLSQKTGRTYRLPSEAEWEKAARGTEGQPYPWGDAWADERCNTSGVETTPVTEPGEADTPFYPEGVSPYGCGDMLGNVEEWTNTLWGSDPQHCDFGYPYDAHDGREEPAAGRHVFQIHRGGSFQDPATNLSDYARSFDHPENRLAWLGFRVVLEI